MKGDPFQTSSVLAHLQEQLTEQRQQIARLREEQQEASETLLDRVQSLLAAQLQQQHQLMDRHTKQQRIRPTTQCQCVGVSHYHLLCSMP